MSNPDLLEVVEIFLEEGRKILWWIEWQPEEVETLEAACAAAQPKIKEEARNE